ncbi:MAG: SoxR reducing system RseC family protein [Muribaculaceae bacterium]|nr:SoxR reducing system RseC family protein [Muribaculaceae bacterium]
MEEQKIRHRAKVISSHIEFTTVEIVPENESGRCSGCRLSSVCGTNHEGRHIVTAATGRDVPPNELRAGTMVEISAAAASRAKASVILLLLPLVIFLTVATALVSAGTSDLASGLAAIAASALFYVALYLKRDRKRPLWTINRIIS